MRYRKVSQAESNFGDSLSPRKWEEIKTAPPELIHKLQHSSLFNNNLEIIKINKFEDGYYYYELNSPNKGLANLLSAEGKINIGGTLLKITQQEIENVSQGTRLTKDEFNQINNNLYQAGLKDYLNHFKRSRLVNLGQFHNFHVIPEYNHFLDTFAPGTSELTSVANFFWHNESFKGAGVSGVAVDFGDPGSGMPTKSFKKSGDAKDGRLKIRGYLDFIQQEAPGSVSGHTVVEVVMALKGLALKRRLAGLWFDANNDATITLTGNCDGTSVQGYTSYGDPNSGINANFTFALHNSKNAAVNLHYLPPSIHQNVANTQGRFYVIGNFVYLNSNYNFNVRADWDHRSASVELRN